MDKKDRNSLLMVAGGAAVAGVSMLAANDLSGLEMTDDALHAADLIFKIITTGASVSSVIGLLRLAAKYGKVVYDYLKEKLNFKSNTNENNQSLTKQNIKSDLKSNSNNLQKDLKNAFSRGAPINQTSRRSARNPALQESVRKMKRNALLNQQKAQE